MEDTGRFNNIEDLNIGKKGAYLLVLLVSMLPLACLYIMDGGKIQEWLCRIQNPSVFPGSDILAANGMQSGALRSGLLFLPFCALYKVTGSPDAVYVIFMILLQVGTFCAAKLMFERAFAGESSGNSALFGVLFYMTSPCRIYLCYDAADISRAMVWLFLPLLVWSALSLKDGSVKWYAVVMGALALAGVGYADAVSFYIILSCMILMCVFRGNWRGLFPVLPGVVLFGWGEIHTFAYLFTDRFQELGIDAYPVADRGYTVGQMFCSFRFQEGLPGMGAGLFLGLAAAVWLIFVAGRWEQQKLCRIFAGMSVFLMVLSLKNFPWGLAKDAGSWTWAARFAFFMETPAVFFGLAQIGLCFPAAWAMGLMSRQQEKVLRIGVVVIVSAICLAAAVWQCNSLTYVRLPLFFEY